MLLGTVKAEVLAWETAVDLAGDVAL